MADTHGNLAEIDEGRSLLPAIVQKEQELEARLAKAKAEAEQVIRDARAAAEKAVEEAQASFPADEDKFLEGELKKYEGELGELEKAEHERLIALRKSATARLDAAASAVIDIVLSEDS